MYTHANQIADTFCANFSCPMFQYSRMTDMLSTAVRRRVNFYLKNNNNNNGMSRANANMVNTVIFPSKGNQCSLITIIFGETQIGNCLGMQGKFATYINVSFYLGTVFAHQLQLGGNLFWRICMRNARIHLLVFNILRLRSLSSS